MQRLFAILIGVCCVLAAASAEAQRGKKMGRAKGKDGKNDIVGAQWRYTLKRGPKQEQGVFRVNNHELFRGPKKIGIAKPNPKQPDETALTITGVPELNGVAVLRKTGRQPARWRGTLKKVDGSEWDLQIVVRDF